MGQRHRLMMSALDFRHALSAATFLMEDVDWKGGRSTQEGRRRLKCYETSMVVSYARPFSTARGMAAPFSWKQLGREYAMSTEEKSLHEMLIDARNRIYAHSDGDRSDITASIWRSNFGHGRTFDFLSVEGGEMLLFEEAHVQAIHTFLWKVRHHIDEAVQHHPAPRDALPVRLIDI
ncbi:hypothetical protein [Blastomonas fulva]|uniref:hypothetical protein n=1 Tax=Blastomonas fulva TaxID=1550728 RepID=UPI003F729907